MTIFIRTEAQPCPECGGSGTAVDCDWLKAWVFCQDCDFKGPVSWDKVPYEAREGAIAAWNRLDRGERKAT
jgi:Restriction alleviation protein Lar